MNSSKIFTHYIKRSVPYYKEFFERLALDGNGRFCVMLLDNNKWIHSYKWQDTDGYSSFDEAKEAADKILLERGCKLLNELESQKYLLLL